jgi:hypothetical protein
LPGVNPGDFNRQASLVELVVECTAAGENDGWLQLGTGAGSIMRYGDKLIISQSEAAHHEIAYLLQDLRQGLESHVSQTEFVHSEK